MNVERILVELLCITISRSLEPEVGTHIILYHVNVLETLTSPGGPFRNLLLEEWFLNLQPQNRVALAQNQSIVTVYTLLDNVRRFRNWSLYEREKGTRQPEIDGNLLRIPAEPALTLWYGLVIHMLVGAFKICMETAEPRSPRGVQCDPISFKSLEAWQDGRCPRMICSPTFSRHKRHAIEVVVSLQPTQVAVDLMPGSSPVSTRRLPVLAQSSNSPQTTQIRRQGQNVSLASLQEALANIQNDLPIYSAQQDARIAELEQAHADLVNKITQKDEQLDSVRWENDELRREKRWHTQGE